MNTNTNTPYTNLPQGINYMNNYLAPRPGAEMAAEIKLVEAMKDAVKVTNPQPQQTWNGKYPGDDNRYS